MQFLFDTSFVSYISGFRCRGNVARWHQTGDPCHAQEWTNEIAALSKFHQWQQAIKMLAAMEREETRQVFAGIWAIVMWGKRCSHLPTWTLWETWKLQSSESCSERQFGVMPSFAPRVWKDEAVRPKLLKPLGPIGEVFLSNSKRRCRQTSFYTTVSSQQRSGAQWTLSDQTREGCRTLDVNPFEALQRGHHSNILRSLK